MALALLLPALSLAQEAKPVENFGFVRGNIWYFPDPFFAGDDVKIYTAVFNGSDKDIVGTVEFFVNDEPIGKTDFSVASGGSLKEVFISWPAAEGRHKFEAKISQARVSRFGQPKEEILLGQENFSQDERYVDLDTDKDGVGNLDDTDDDNDGTTDIEELRLGTDPLKAEKAQNGSTALSSTTQQLVSKIAEKTPNAIVKAVEAVNSLADKGVEKLEEKKEELKKEIEQIKEQEERDQEGELNSEQSQAQGEAEEAADEPQGEEPGPVQFVAGEQTRGETAVVEAKREKKGNRLLKEFYLLVISVLTFLLKNKILMYLVGGVVLYNLVKIFLKILLRRGRA